MYLQNDAKSKTERKDKEGKDKKRNTENLENPRDEKLRRHD